MPSLRLFFALETPDPVRSRAASLLHTLQESGAEVKWEPTSKLHSTVRFLGDTDTSLIGEITRTASALASSSRAPHIRYHRLGAFPNLRHPRVLWIGMDDLDGTLANFHRNLERELLPLGFDREPKTFHPHITLGRVRGEKKIEHLIRLLESLTFESEPVFQAELLLMKSDLRPSGSVYTIQQAFPFTTR